MTSAYQRMIDDCIDERIKVFCRDHNYSLTSFYKEYFNRQRNLEQVTIDHAQYFSRMKVMAYKGTVRNHE